MIKGLIVTDLDGTLLDSRGLYSKRSRDYLRRLSHDGYIVVLASGRPYRAMAHIYEDLECTGPVIAYNGGLVFHPGHDDFPRYEKRFCRDDVLSIRKASEGIVDVYMAESDENLYVEGDGTGLFPYFPNRDIKIVEGPIADTLKENPFTCLFHELDKAEGKLESICENHPNIAYRSWSNSNYSELAIPGVHKGTALVYIMQQYGLNKEDVYAFGDASNDEEMLEVSGHPFVMKNARANYLKDIYPVTKNTVEEDGVIAELESLLI